MCAMTEQHESRSPLGKTAEEDEPGHLRRVAEELGGANSGPLETLKLQLVSGSPSARLAAAAGLGALGDRHAIAVLRTLLEADEPTQWELAVHGLRQSRDRAGWLCLESVALDLVHTLEEADSDPPHAFRLLVMGRTKTMDRLFRAIDGHSRSLSAGAARAFATVAVASVPGDMSIVMAMRLGLLSGHPATPEEVAGETGLTLPAARELESRAWETVQRSRTYSEIKLNYDDNVNRLRAAD